MTRPGPTPPELGFNASQHGWPMIYLQRTFAADLPNHVRQARTNDWPWPPVAGEQRTWNPTGLLVNLLANALLYVTASLSEDGTPIVGMEGDGDGMDIFETFSAPKGVKFLGEEGHKCAYRKLAMAAAPCYVGCILHPLKWGEEAEACKVSCQSFAVFRMAPANPNVPSISLCIRL